MSNDVVSSPPLHRIGSLTGCASVPLSRTGATVGVRGELPEKRRWLRLRRFKLAIAPIRFAPATIKLACSKSTGRPRRSWATGIALVGISLAVMPRSSSDAATTIGLDRPRPAAAQQMKSDGSIFDSLLGKSENKGGATTAPDKSKDQQQVAWCNAGGIKVTMGKSGQLEFMTVILPVRTNVNEQTMLQQMQRILRQSSVAMTGRGQCMFVPDKKEQIDQLKQRRAEFLQGMQARRMEVIELFANNFPANMLGDNPTRPR